MILKLEVFKLLSLKQTRMFPDIVSVRQTCKVLLIKLLIPGLVLMIPTHWETSLKVTPPPYQTVKTSSPSQGLVLRIWTLWKDVLVLLLVVVLGSMVAVWHKLWGQTCTASIALMTTIWIIVKGLERREVIPTSKCPEHLAINFGCQNFSYNNPELLCE